MDGIMNIPDSLLAKKSESMGKLHNAQFLPAIQVSTVQDLETFGDIREDWASLLEQSPNRDIFLTWEWLFTWQKHLGGRGRLWLVTARIGDELVGIAPLMLNKIKKHGMEMKLLNSLGSPHIDVGGFIVKNNDPQIYLELCNHIIRQKNDWDVLELDEVDADKGRINLIKSTFKQAGFSTLETDDCHFYLDTSGDWKDYFQQLPKKTRHEFRRKAKHVEISACTRFVRHTGQDVSCEDMETMFAINKHGHFPEFYEHPKEQDFQNELRQRLSQNGSLDISFLHLDDEPVAFCYGFIHDKRLEIWRIGFDTKFCVLSVGIVLVNWVLEDSFKKGIREVDFLRGDEGYKEQWKPQSRTYTQLRAVSSGKLKPLINSIWLPELARFMEARLDRVRSSFKQKQQPKKA